MFRLLKTAIIAALVIVFALPIVKWIILFFVAAIFLPFLFLTRIIEINFQNLSQAFEFKFPNFNIDIYRTPFPIVHMNPKFLVLYKNFRMILFYIANFLGFAFIIFFLFKIAPKDYRKSFTRIKPRWASLRNKKVISGFFGLLLTVFVVGVVFSQILILPAFKIYSTSKNIIDLAEETKTLLVDQNFYEAKGKLTSLKEEIKMSQRSLNALSWMKIIPIIKNYHSDIENLFFAADYATNAGIIATDILPLMNSSSLEKLDQLTPRLDEILNNFSLAKSHIDNIDPNRYPKSFMGKPFREKLVLAKNKIEQVDEGRKNFQPLLKILPSLIGMDKPKYYLVLFQNENKIRPTGGSIVSYGVLRIENGRIIPEVSGDIADLERTVLRFDRPPEVISRYSGSQFFYLKDANISPDFSESMKNFEKIYQNSYQKRHFDGIIAIDGEFFFNLIKVLGPTVVYDKILTADIKPACDCPGIIADIDQLALSNRKEIIGVLLNAILIKSISSPPRVIADLAASLVKSAQEKHLLFYLTDEDQQKILDSTGFAGRIIEYSGDYLHINEANFSEDYEDRSLIRKVEDKTEIGSSGEVSKTITMTYQKSTLAKKTTPLVLRFYIPKESEALSGNRENSIITEDLGKKVFETKIEVSPQTQQTITLKYRLPFKASDGDYKLFRQKQPGIIGYEYKILLNENKTEVFYFDKDRELTLSNP